MSKINVNEIEAVTTNGNLSVAPNGTGILEVSGDSPGTLQLDDASGNGVKIKAPDDSSGQNYTLVLPTSTPTQGDYLHVDSITGSGSTATGQLGYASITPPNANSIPANQITTGTMPDARYGVANLGGGFQLVSNTITTSTVQSVEVTGLEANTLYQIDADFKIVSGYNDRIFMHWLDSSGSAWDSIRQVWWYGSGDDYADQTTTSVNTYTGYDGLNTSLTAHLYTGDLDGSTDKEVLRPWTILRSIDTSSQYTYNGSTIFASFMDSINNRRIHGLRFRSQCNYNLESPCSVRVYKYSEG